MFSFDLFVKLIVFFQQVDKLNSEASYAKGVVPLQLHGALSPERQEMCPLNQMLL